MNLSENEKKQMKAKKKKAENYVGQKSSENAENKLELLNCKTEFFETVS